MADLTDAVAEAICEPFRAMSIEMVYHGGAEGPATNLAANTSARGHLSWRA